MHCYGALECAFTYKQPICVVYKHALDLGLLGREMETFEQLLQPRVEFVVAVVGVNHGRCQPHFCLGQTFTFHRHLDSRFECETELSCSIVVHSRDSPDKVSG